MHWQSCVRVLVGSTCAALVACSVGTAYRRPDIPLPREWHDPATASVWPSADWWHGFGSARLDELIAEAERSNDDLAGAIARVQEADAQARIAGAPLLPSVDLSGAATRERANAPTTGPSVFNNFNPEISASYELDFWGKNRALRDSGRNVSNSIAHDLRTPLAELRSRLEELALIRPSPEKAFGEIDAAVGDVDRVIRIFDALLRLAEIDAGMRRSGFLSLDLIDLASAAVEFYAPAAELKHIQLGFHGEGPLPVLGDPILLAQALGNLIDNALKYAPENGAIDVAVRRRSDTTAEISVTDDGPGIGDSEKAKVFERFYRGDASRGTPGVGLGLSLVQAVAKLHGSVLELSDRNPGLRVVLLLPCGESQTLPSALAAGEDASPPPPSTAAAAGAATATTAP